MSEGGTRIRLMKSSDFEAVVAIDEKVFRTARPQYYEMKFEKVIGSKDSLPVSFVAESEAGRVVGFVMGELYMGEYGIFQGEATLDTIGVDPDCQDKGIGQQLINEFVDHLKDIGVKKINTLVAADDVRMTRFFNLNRFSPSKTLINLERVL